MTFRRVLLVLSLLILPAAAASAQTPAGPPRINDTTSPSFLKSAAVDGLGNLTLLFEISAQNRIYGRRFSAAGPPLGPEFELKRAGLSPKVAANERGDTVILWDGGGTGNPVWVRKLSPGQPPLNLAVNRRGTPSLASRGTSASTAPGASSPSGGSWRVVSSGFAASGSTPTAPGWDRRSSWTSRARKARLGSP